MLWEWILWVVVSFSFMYAATFTAVLLLFLCYGDWKGVAVILFFSPLAFSCPIRPPYMLSCLLVSIMLWFSVPLSVNSIFEEVMKSEDGRTMTLEHVRVALIELGCDLPSISLDETYSIGNLLLFFSPQLILLENISMGLSFILPTLVMADQIFCIF